MPRKAKIEDPELPLEETREEREIGEFLEGFGDSSIRVKLFRQRGMTGLGAGQWEYVGTADPSALTEDTIQQTYGPGRYQLRIVGVNNKYVAQTMVSIGAPAGGDKDKPAAIPAPVYPSSEISLLREQISLMQAMLLKMIESAGSRPQTAGPTMAEIMQAVRELRESVPTPDPGAYLKQTMDAWMRGVEAAQIMNPPEDGNKAMLWMRVIEKASELLPKALETVAGGMAGRVAGRVVSPVSLLQQAVRFLKPKARAGSDPGLWIDVALEYMDSLDPESISALVQLLDQPMEQFTAHVDSELADEPYRAWFSALKGELVDAIRNVDTGGERGNQGDLAGDGRDGAVGLTGAAGGAGNNPRDNSPVSTGIKNGPSSGNRNVGKATDDRY